MEIQFYFNVNELYKLVYLEADHLPRNFLGAVEKPKIKKEKC
jgi:hypothetical protein